MVELSEKNASVALLHCKDFKAIETITLSLRAKYLGYQFMPQYKIGAFDGYKNFYKRISNDILEVPRNCIELVLKHLKLPFNSITDTNTISWEEFNSFIEKLDLPFKPYNYQIQAAYDSLINKTQINLMATGSGKSLTIYILIRWLLTYNPNFKILLLVPNLSLLTQMESDFRSYGWQDIDKYLKKVGGKHKDKDINTPLTIATWQSIKNITTELKNVDVVIEDEVHRASSDIHTYVIFPKCINAYYRFGFTGTIDKKDKLKQLAIMATFGRVKTYVTAPDLIKMNLATEIEIIACNLNYNLGLREKVRFMNYKREIDFILNYRKRIQYIVNLLKGLKGNTIVLFNTIENGKLLISSMLNRPFDESLRIYGENKNIYFISGDSKAEDRENIRLGMENKDNCIIFGTTSIMSTGINIKKLHNIVFASGGKSFISVNQSIGRLLRLHESKNIVKLYDIIDDLKLFDRENYLYKHSKERIKIYEDNGYKIHNINIHIN